MSEANHPKHSFYSRDNNGAHDPACSSAPVWVILIANEVLIIFLQLKHQGPLSNLNSAFLSSYAVAIFLCCASLAASNDPQILALYPIWVPILSGVSLLLGVLATALLLVIVYPPLGWPMFLVWLLVLVIVVRKTGDWFYQLAYEAIVATISNLANSIGGFGSGAVHVGLARPPL